MFEYVNILCKCSLGKYFLVFFTLSEVSKGKARFESMPELNYILKDSSKQRSCFSISNLFFKPTQTFSLGKPEIVWNSALQLVWLELYKTYMHLRYIWSQKSVLFENTNWIVIKLFGSNYTNFYVRKLIPHIVNLVIAWNIFN